MDSKFTLASGDWQAECISIVNAVERTYGPGKRKGIDFRSLKEEVARRVESDASTSDAIPVLIEFFAKLRNGHSNLLGVRKSSLPLGLEFIGGKVVVTESSLSEMTVGMRIVEVDDVPVADWMKDRQKYVNASTDYSRQNGAMDQIKTRYFFESSTRKYTVEDIEGTTRTIEIEIDESRPKTSGAMLKMERHGDNGYIAINAMENEAYEVFREKLPGLISCKSIILDLRRNTGGNSSISRKMLSHFVSSPAKTWGSNRSISPSKDLNYNGPLYVIVGRNTFSAAESFVFDLYDSHRGLFFGSTTGGDSGGGPQTFVSRGGVSYRVPMRAHDKSVSGLEMEGRGFTPQFSVVQTYSDVLARQDTVLNFVLLFAENKQREP